MKDHDRSYALGRGSTALLLALAILPNVPVLWIGFLHDDLFHFLHGFIFDGVGSTVLERWVPRPGEEFYRPLTDTTFGINYILGGAHPLGFRLVDLLLHGLATWLAARFVLALTGRRSAALVVGGLMALHPLAVRAICWTSDRYVVLATIFTLASLLLYVRWRQGGGWIFWPAALGCQCLGLLSKESAAAIPVALVVVEACWRPGPEDRAVPGAAPGPAPSPAASPGRPGRTWIHLAAGVWAFVLLDLLYLAFRYAAFGDLAGYRDVATGAVVYPLTPARVAHEALIDLPWALVWPINLDWIQGVARVAVGVVSGGSLLALVLLAWRERWRGGPDRQGGRVGPSGPGDGGDPRCPGDGGGADRQGGRVGPSGPGDSRVRATRLRTAWGGLALGYALLLPSLPYFYLGRDLLKAYHLYPTMVGFGLAAWALLGSRGGRVPFVLLLALYAILAREHATVWIDATRTVRTFQRWLKELDPPLEPSRTVWVSGVPNRSRGALVLEASRMKKNLEVLLGRRLGRVKGMGYPWCRVSADEVRASLASGARWIRFDPETGRCAELPVRPGLSSSEAPRVLVDRGEPVSGQWGPGGTAWSGDAKGGWRFRNRAGWLEWTGPAVEPVRYAEIQIRMRVRPAHLASFDTAADQHGFREGAIGPPLPVRTNDTTATSTTALTTTGNLRWTREHHSPWRISRLARFPVVADGRWRNYRVDLTRSGWVHEGEPIRCLRLSAGRGDMVVNVDRIALISW